MTENGTDLRVGERIVYIGEFVAGGECGDLERGDAGEIISIDSTIVEIDTDRGVKMYTHLTLLERERP